MQVEFINNFDEIFIKNISKHAYTWSLKIKG